MSNLNNSVTCGGDSSTSNDSYNLFAVGFCGIDDTVQIDEIIQLSKEENCEKYVEWGVLFRPEKAGEPRFASAEYVKSLTEKAKSQGINLRLAAHLCSTRCEEVLNGKKEFIQELAQQGFKRVQVNATKANNVNIEDLKACVEPLKSVIKESPNIEWIIQKNEETKPIWEELLSQSNELSNMSILFDDSVGRGIEISSFPEPFADIPAGYAGGIGPNNIEKVLERLCQVKNLPARGPWIDMESSLRDTASNKDVFSLTRAKECIIHVKKLAKAGVLTLP